MCCIIMKQSDVLPVSTSYVLFQYDKVMFMLILKAIRCNVIMMLHP